ncbi:Uma2 family endonuclease [Leptolyngbya sp. FACHB-261]|uniref:Uma2 family endonuclease n=1 Tax=Leptolyngbya sp. FACHB-261 TaxID=2692806 RepID=UPI0016899F77|nr:Uma2 family endonuclease [Leptolyngbya sp. FACHB-261]MBD2099783.1 Uma2 family endonuclease [Leptolyngbya sp. FACHB-261]
MLAELIHDLEQDYPGVLERGLCLLMSGVSWQYYEALICKLEDRASLRLTYLDGELEVVAPSRRQEGIKKRIAILLEAYFEETDTEYFPLGSTTFRSEQQRGGSEPDESYCLGVEKDVPDLVVEVSLTSGGIDKLTVYQRLKIPEIWFWQDEQLSIYCLREGQYEKVTRSELLPKLELELLKAYILHPQPLSAVKEFRQRIRQSM